MKYKVLVTDPISDSGIKILENHNCEVINRIDTKDTIDNIIDQIDAWIIRSGTQISEDHINKAKKIQVIGRAGVGIDNIDIKAATKNGIVVMNVPDGNSISAAEHTMAMILALSRNLHLGHITLEKGLWERANLIGNELNGKVLGVVGLGKIGKEVIDRALSFGLKILGYDPYVNKDLYSENTIEIVDIDRLTKESDIITLHVPLNDSTRDLFDLKRIKMMKKSASIINVARGGIINEEDLNRALNEDLIFGAGLDVFEKEPPSIDNPLLKNEKAFLSPHSAVFTEECLSRMGIETVQNIIDFFDNKLEKSKIVKIS